MVPCIEAWILQWIAYVPSCRDRQRGSATSRDGDVERTAVVGDRVADAVVVGDGELGPCGDRGDSRRCCRRWSVRPTSLRVSYRASAAARCGGEHVAVAVVVAAARR